LYFIYLFVQPSLHTYLESVNDSIAHKVERLSNQNNRVRISVESLKGGKLDRT